MTGQNIGRREFVGRSAALGVGMWTASSAARVLGANERIRLGLIGAGARGPELLSQARKLPALEAVAVPDVYARPPARGGSLLPAIQAFTPHPALPHRQDVQSVF